MAVCTEDFERERQDRARAQTEKDSVSNRLHRKAEDLAKLNTEVRVLFCHVVEYTSGEPLTFEVYYITCSC